MDLAVAGGLGLAGGGLLFGLGGDPVRRGLGDPGVPLDGGGVRDGEVLDVAGRVDDLLDLQGVDDQPELLHLQSGGGPGLAGEPLAVADHVLDGESADDRPQVSGEDVVDALADQFLLVQEAAGGVGDGDVVVADLEDDHALDPDRDALRGDALDVQFGLVEVQREPPDALQARRDEGPPAGDDPEAQPVTDPLGAVAGTGDDQCLVRFGHPPHELEERDHDHHGRGDRPGDDESHGSTPPSGAGDAPKWIVRPGGSQGKGSDVTHRHKVVTGGSADRHRPAGRPVDDPADRRSARRPAGRQGPIGAT